MSENTQKPKRTITPEQREKMAEGRKKAMEERRKTKDLIKKEEKDAKTKYNVITNDLLVVKNKYRGSIKCYKANNPNNGEIKFD